MEKDPARQDERKKYGRLGGNIGGKWAENLQKIVRIRKHVGRKTLDGLPCLGI